MALHHTIIHHSKNFLARAHKVIRHIHKKITAPVAEENNILTPILPENTEQRIMVDISTFSAIKIIAVVFGIIVMGDLLFQISNILLLFFLSLFLSAALHPGVAFLEKYKIPPSIGVLIWYFLIFGMLVFVFAELLPAIVTQLTVISEKLIDIISKVYFGDFSPLPHWMEKFAPQIQGMLKSLNIYLGNSSTEKNLINILQTNTDKLESLASNLGTGLSSFVFGFVNWVFELGLVLVLTFFIVSDVPTIKLFFIRLFPELYQEYVSYKSIHVQKKIAEWVHGQMILFAVVAIIQWVGLSLIGVEYALTLSFLAGLSEFLPYIGPTIVVCTAAPIAFGESLEHGFLVLALYTGIQMIEGNILVPLVMKRAIGMPPIVTILVMLIGWEFLGILGIILAVPVASIAAIFVMDYQQRGNKKESL
ncbi:MAG: AI-2E family transporter [Candidatus Peregrinibacteria bacterium]